MGLDFMNIITCSVVVKFTISYTVTLIIMAFLCFHRVITEIPARNVNMKL